MNMLERLVSESELVPDKIEIFAARYIVLITHRVFVGLVSIVGGINIINSILIEFQGVKIGIWSEMCTTRFRLTESQPRKGFLSEGCADFSSIVSYDDAYCLQTG